MTEHAHIDGSVIQTASGLYVDPLALGTDDIRLEDVAHALANQCRFSGHTKAFYSVAEHSVRVADLLREWGEDTTTILWGLTHDATEAYLVDLPSPLKHYSEFGEAYRVAEARAQVAVCAAFDLPPEMPEAVARADRVMLSTERRDLMPADDAEWVGLVEPHARVIETLNPGAARAVFLDWAEGLIRARVSDALAPANSYPTDNDPED